jgi:ribosomal protein S13
MATTCAEAAAVYTDTIHVKKASNNSPERVFLSMILSIPGLGKQTAEAVAKACEASFVRLQAMTEEELAAIPTGKRSLGKKVAHTIHEVIHRG